MTQPTDHRNGLADRVLTVMSLFTTADGDLGVTEISASLSLDKSVVHRILTALVRHGYLDRDPDTRRYRVGLRAWELGRRYTAITDISRVATPPMRRLVEELDATGYVCRLEGLEIVYIAVVPSSGPLRVHVDVGSRAHAHTTAVGKAMLAALPPAELRALLGSRRSLPRQTEASIRGPAQLVAELKTVREQGYALNRGEHNRGVGSVGVALLDTSGRPLAGLSAAFPMLPQFEPLWSRLPASLARVVDEVGARLGSYVGDRAALSPAAPDTA